VKRTIAIAQPCVGEEEWQALRQPLESGWLTQGPKVAAFEAAFARRHSVAHALAVTSCTTGLHLALTALEVGPGDEVIVPAFTWVATANVVLYCGATPVFADVDPRTYNLDPEDLAARLSDRTRVVIPVHLFGLCADMDAIRAVLPEHVVVLEDAACAAGATYHGRSAGALGDAGVFSFHPRKSITTGEGGMLTTADPRMAARAEMLRNHGASVPEKVRHQGPEPYLMPDFDELGFNYRMTDLQAAVGIVQLTKLDAFIAERDRWARWYAECLADLLWLSPPLVPEGYGHAWQAYVTRVEEDAPCERNEVMRRLQDAGIGTRPGTHAVSELSLYRRSLGLEPGRFATASDLQARTMALPLHNRMTEADYEHVADQLHRL
jgi:dTDP-4-amino-4,6-dideoxygalactose transaminase